MATEVIMYQAPPLHVTVTRGQKGTYGWDISVRGDDRQAILAEIKATDERLRKDYPATEGN